MQAGSVDKAMYYDALPTRCYCGLFYFPVVTVTPCYYAFQFFNGLYRLENEVASASDEQGVYCCAATDGTRKAILLVNNSSEAKQVFLKLNGASEQEFTLHTLDSSRKFPYDEAVPKVGGIWLSPISVCLLDNDAHSSAASRKEYRFLF